ncbi:MAG TPA: pyridoxamine 5'-phosphate oxidase family protein [Pseudonocardia sp.]|uniref:pyridoxamine 5'-phosphate oxidase family protein n=1 Tax=Pseudonocardia sp. TaxID=60912 RepID=UPI002EDB24D7
MNSTYHPGERAAQAKAGLSAEAERVGGIVRTAVPPAAAEFLVEQPMLVVAAADEQGRMWASLLTGAPGFLCAGVVAGRDVVDVAARPLPSDPLATTLTRRVQLGAIAIDPATRRRMRINGVVQPAPDGLRVTADQVYANCPKYIQRRVVEAVGPAGAEGEATVSDTLSPADRRMINEADTFFIATASATGDADASHRGGDPGFVRVAQDGALTWPDYPGNAMMMTLGNLEQNRAAGLLFVDWFTGTTLQLTGTAHVEWATSDRRLRFRPDQVRRTMLASPLRWSSPEYSRFNLPVGTEDLI